MGGRSSYDKTRLHCMRRAIPEHRTSFEFAETYHCTKIIRVSIKGSEQRVWDATAPGRITCWRGKHGRLTGRPSQRSALSSDRDGSIRISGACGQGPDALAGAEVGFWVQETRTCMGKPAALKCDSCPYTGPRRDYNRSKIFEALDRVRAICMKVCLAQGVAFAGGQAWALTHPPGTPQVRGRKALVLEPEFAGPLGLVVEASALREHGVEMCARACVLSLERGGTRPRSHARSFCPTTLTPPFSPLVPQIRRPGRRGAAGAPAGDAGRAAGGVRAARLAGLALWRRAARQPLPAALRRGPGVHLAPGPAPDPAGGATAGRRAPDRRRRDARAAPDLDLHGRGRAVPGASGRAARAGRRRRRRLPLGPGRGPGRLPGAVRRRAAHQGQGRRQRRAGPAAGAHAPRPRRRSARAGCVGEEGG